MRPEDQSIKLQDTTREPPHRPIFHLSPDELEVLKEKIDELLLKGFIRPSDSPYGAPVLFAKKPDGTLRMCIDYRALNANTIKDKTPLPYIPEMRDRLTGSTIFTCFDLRDGFYNLRMALDSIGKTAFRTRFGSYEFLVCPMGLSNSPACFMKMMNRIFRDLYDKFLIAYLDDMLVFSKTFEDHIRHLETTLQRLQDHCLHVKLVKCTFAQPSVTFCGHIISEHGLAISPDKITAVSKPSCTHQYYGTSSHSGLDQLGSLFYQEFCLNHPPTIIPTPKIPIIRMDGAA